MPVSTPFNSPMVASGGDSSEPTKHSCQPIQNISLRLPPMVASGGDSSEPTKHSCQPIQNISLRLPSMMSRMYEHVTTLKKATVSWSAATLRQSSPSSAQG
jgi:hypothetical protein